MRERLNVIVCAASDNEGWRWLVDRLPDLGPNWRFIYYKNTILSRIIRKPDIKTVWSGWRTAWYARRLSAELIITQTAEGVFWTALFCRFFSVDAKHLAVAFNYPNCPKGIRHWLMCKAFRSVSRFEVSSQVEKKIYIKYFGIPSDKIDVQPWKMGRWNSIGAVPVIDGDYVCALGEYGRDYGTLLRAISCLPHIHFVLVVRRHSLEGLHVPANVTVLIDTSHEEAFNIINFCRFMVLPLATEEMPTGHITLVSAMHSEKAVVVTHSAGIVDYAHDGENFLSYPARDFDSLAACINKLWLDRDLCEKLGKSAMKFASEHCSEGAAVAHLEQLLSKYVRTKLI